MDLVTVRVDEGSDVRRKVHKPSRLQQVLLLLCPVLICEVECFVLVIAEDAVYRPTITQASCYVLYVLKTNAVRTRPTHRSKLMRCLKNGREEQTSTSPLSNTKIPSFHA